MEFPFPSHRVSGYAKSVARENLEALRRDVPGSRKELVLLNTSRVIDGKYMDYAAELKNWDIKPVGALVQCSDHDTDDDDDELIGWIGTKPESSLVFVSFGSEALLGLWVGDEQCELHMGC